LPKAKIEPTDNGIALDPIIDALLEHLPAPGEYWSKDDRALWLRMIELTFELVYDDQPDASTAEPNEPAGLHGH
jgi:hypothetical protein